MKRTVRDVMTTTVVVVAAETPFKEVARRLSEYRVAALPVVDARDQAIGMVSEADLLLKEEATVAPTARRRQRGRVARLEARKSAGTTAMELMTSPAVTVTPDDPLGVAARRMHEGGYRSMPVVNAEGRIIGIVSRRDLLRAFLRPDESILREIEDEVLPSVLEVEPGAVSVSVKEGVVSLRGQVERASMIPILIRLVHGVDGVVQVYEHLTFGFDDTHLRPDIRTPWGVVPRAV